MTVGKVKYMNVLISCRPDHLERRWYQNQQQRQTTGSGGTGRLIRGLGGAKHLSEAYDDDDLLRLQQDDANVAALLLDDVSLGGGYGTRNSVSASRVLLASALGFAESWAKHL